EFDAVPVLEVGHLAPRRAAGDRLHVLGGGDRGSSLLELDRLGPGVSRDVDESLRDLDVAVVVEADLADDVGRVAGPDRVAADLDAHAVLLRSSRMRSASSRTAPSPPF